MHILENWCIWAPFLLLEAQGHRNKLNKASEIIASTKQVCSSYLQYRLPHELWPCLLDKMHKVMQGLIPAHRGLAEVAQVPYNLIPARWRWCRAQPMGWPHTIYLASRSKTLNIAAYRTAEFVQVRYWHLFTIQRISFRNSTFLSQPKYSGTKAK